MGPWEQSSRSGARIRGDHDELPNQNAGSKSWSCDLISSREGAKGSVATTALRDNQTLAKLDKEGRIAITGRRERRAG